MGAPTQVYVDPAINANSGSGTIGDPYGDLQHALNTVAADTTNGNQFNIKAGAAELLSSSLSLATYGNPFSGNFGRPLIFRGYSAVANDGGIGEISCGGANVSVLSAFSGIAFIDVRMGNCGSAAVLNPSSSCLIFRCELHSAGYGILNGGGNFGIVVADCHIHGITIDALNMGGNSCVIGNYISQPTGTSAINITSGSAIRSIEKNIISVSGAVHGILIAGYYSRISGNSILSASGSGAGIRATGDFGAYGAHFVNNLIEGFSGGTGILWNTTAQLDAMFAAGNAVNNCQTPYSFADQQFPGDGDNETLASSPFAKSGANTFANRFAYFALNDVGNVKDGAYPVGSNLSKGAVQFAGGGPPRPVNPFTQQVIG